MATTSNFSKNDTGASHHITPDQSHLLSASEFTDPDQVLLGNEIASILYLLRFDHLLVELRSSTSLFVELRSSLLTFITASHCSIITAHVFGEILIFGILLQAAFLSALVGSEVAYSAAQATVATLSEAYETTKNHRSFPRNTSLQGSGNSWLQHGFNSTNTFGINEYRQGPLYSVFPTKPAQVSSVQDLFEFICSGPLLEKIGVTAEMVAEYIDKWLLYGRLLSQLFQLNELYLTVPQKARIYQYYIPVFLWCEDQIKQHWSTFKNEEDVPPLVIGFSAPQGCGKTTLVFALDYLFQKTGRKSATISIDDFYLTAEGQGKLREANPGNSLLEVVIHMICRRVADPSTWPEVEGPLTVVLFEGWMLGFKPLPTEVVKAVDLQVRTRNSYLVFHGEGSSQVNL
ncbi:D-glycerate 3-kinase, chloroplastic-like [Arachis ipaensis]|uniref:D-glycerate 3-kinase, chloroplastic-like n=1 Tax=Arachis ipaensis TaxID=130454 RepID=UPI000A2B8AC9|nr:D-glycerate 3-kinase, chloroplastic-like [Arachis ipaensis]